MRYVDESRSIFPLFHSSHSSRFSVGTFTFLRYFSLFSGKGVTQKLLVFQGFKLRPFEKLLQISHVKEQGLRERIAQRKRGCDLGGGGLKLVAAVLMDVFFHDFFVAIN